MKRITPVLFLVIFVPIVVFAQSGACSPYGYTIVFVNGILTSQSEADLSKNVLKGYLQREISGQPVNVQLGYNPSHLVGAGDFLESVTQAFGKPISNFDLNTILMQIYPEVTTRKILLVGHSQGSFYTNEMYDYLTSHGVPKESIAVYNIATPASFVAGGGQYITSSNDKLINAIRDAEVNGNVHVYADSYYTINNSVIASALRANTTIPKEQGWETDDYGGHHFDVYMSGVGARIVKDINSELAKLKVVDTPESTEGCFTPPHPGLAYQAQETVLQIGDSLASASSVVDSTLANAGLTISNTRGAFTNLVQDVVQKLAGLFNESSLSTKTGQAAVVALAVGGQPNQSNTPPSSVPQAVPQYSQPPTEVTSPLPPPNPATPPSGTEPPVAPSAVPSPGLIPVGNAPGFGGGGGGSTPAQQPQPATAATPVTLSVDIPADNAFSTTPTVTFAGTATAGAVITANSGATSASSTADGGGNWNMPLALAEGAAHISFTASDSSGTVSPAVTRDLVVDTIPPAAATPAVAECAASLSTARCLVATTTLGLTWNDANDAIYYGVAQNGFVVATTSATSTLTSVLPDATTNLSIVSYDEAGNTATSSDISVDTVVQPVIINEIAWGGDTADHTHQWIELKNVSPYTLDVSHLAIVRSGESSTALSGSVPSSGNPFLVVEPTNIAGTGSQKLVVAFNALSTTTAEQVALVWNGSTTIDATPAPSSCSGWCAGKYNAQLGTNTSGVAGLFSPLSMERVSGASDGTQAVSWHDTDSYGPWLGVGSTAALWGTPGAENSSGLPDSGVYCGVASNLVQTNSNFNPGNSGCVYLMRFITGDSRGVNRVGALYRGDVTNSTNVNSHSFAKALAASASDSVPADAVTGEHYFFAMWENRTFGNDNLVFNFYFTQGASSTQGITGPPHGNYVTIPWVYTP